MFGQIVLLILIYWAANFGVATLHDRQVAAAIDQRAAADRAAAEAAGQRAEAAERELSDVMIPAPPAYDAPPVANDARAEVMNGVLFRRDAHYRPGSAEARAQAAAEVARRQGD